MDSATFQKVLLQKTATITSVNSKNNEVVAKIVRKKMAALINDYLISDAFKGKH